MTPQEYGQLALSLPEACQGEHMGKTDFRRFGKIFATVGYPDAEWGMAKLTPEQQDDVIAAYPQHFRPVPGAWGRQGCTLVALVAPAEIVLAALQQAYGNLRKSGRNRVR